MYPSFRQLTNRTNLPNFSFIRIRDLLFRFHLFLFSFFFSFFALYDDQRKDSRRLLNLARTGSFVFLLERGPNSRV